MRGVSTPVRAPAGRRRDRLSGMRLHQLGVDAHSGITAAGARPARRGSAGVAGEQETPQKFNSSMATVSPELALVDPDLRALAIAALPAVRPYAFLEHPAVPLVVAPTTRRRSRTPRLRAAAVYFVVALARTLTVNVAVLLGIGVLVLILSLIG